MRASELKMGHMTLTMPLLAWFAICRLEFDTFYLYAKFDDSKWVT